jgi:hypothetical protein
VQEKLEGVDKWDKITYRIAKTIELKQAGKFAQHVQARAS